MDTQNGVKIGKLDHCKECKCANCRRPYTMKDYIECPYADKPCATCNETAFIQECLFFESRERKPNF